MTSNEQLLRLPLGPSELLRYFEGVDHQFPNTHSRNGAEMCWRWQELIREGATQADVDQFLLRLNAEPNPGSGWQDLGLQFRHWAKSQGFRDDIGKRLERVRNNLALYDRYRPALILFHASMVVVFIGILIYGTQAASRWAQMQGGVLPGYLVGIFLGAMIGMLGFKVGHALGAALIGIGRLERLLLKYCDDLRMSNSEPEAPTPPTSDVREHRDCFGGAPLLRRS